VISPLLANIYLHYVLDVWVQAWRRAAAGDVIIVRYADDFVLGFQYRGEAERFRRDLEQRLRKFGLELHPDKTRLIEFGRFAASNRRQRGEGKPETFSFLGFTHISGRQRQSGRFCVIRLTAGKRMRAELKQIKQQLQRRMHEPVVETGKWFAERGSGYFRYMAVPGNGARLTAFRDAVIRLWKHVLCRRGQPDSGIVCARSLHAGSAGSYPSSPFRTSASPPNIQGRSRMRETRSYGSVRGASGD
jgi:hypothetical protein